MNGNGQKSIRQIDVGRGEDAEAGDFIAEFDRRFARVEVDIQANANEVDVVEAFTKQAGEFSVVVKQVVGPFELDGGVAGELGGGGADRQAGEQREFMRREMGFDGNREGHGQVAGGRGPGIGPPSPASSLARGQNDGRGRKVAAFS